eukprot:TRINITY_DN739_c0_g1_i3.p1 TRINITY_DN739_c0_g1~~TRINITY_DN739_c0_g1_i3.p1  ORF type:complete len:327 (+),score=97.43 TRINITY_DN739_c0_g1_i3:77-982(+)
MAKHPDLDDATLRRCLDVSISAAQEAGNLMLECMAKNDATSSIEAKANPADLVTKYDRQVEDLVLAQLRAAFPKFNVLAEETASDAQLTNDPTWIVDPIDGTTNFIHRQPECCCLIGLAVNKKAVLGVLFIPKMDEMYTAVRGWGAYCNGRPIRTSGCKDLRQAMLNAHFPSYTRGPKVVERLLGIHRDLLAHPIRAMRAGGSAGVDMAHVARGRLDGYFEVGIYPWDVCAGSVIVEEAGGVCLDTLGGPHDLGGRRVLAAATPELAAELAVYLRKHRYASTDAADWSPDAAGSPAKRGRL